jgi:predicted dehydrogenase/threonine dehydrogenase-like Zn-dependent dehydrogenase
LKQILQNLSNGKTTLVDIPCPKIVKGSLLIASSNTLVSNGTERMLVDFGKANMLDKARQQPDKVKKVLGKVKSDGFLPTIDAVRSKLDQPLPLGYCNAGVVIESTVEGFSIGERVVSNGNHAEVVRVSQNLCAKIPDNVDDESAAFTVMGAIGMQGIRLIQPSLGECFVVTGLGMIGLLCVQMLRANGCRVLGVDFDSKKCEIAREYGAETVDLSNKEDPVLISQSFSRGRGVDGVLIAATSESDEVMHQAAQMCRKRGRIVLVGVVGLDLRRDDFYKKEITFQVSASYGPGRYDPFYEEQGNDYPIGFVRWTQQRNFEAVLDMMSLGKLDLKSLITHRYDIEDAVEAYALLNNPSTLGIILDYPKSSREKLKTSKVVLTESNSNIYDPAKPCVGFIGAGNYASRILIPAFKQTGVMLDTLVTSGGISGLHHGNKNGFLVASTEISDLWNDKINTVCIATQHNAHASQVIEALNNGNNVFVEKPLALTIKEIDLIDKTYQSANHSNNVRLMVGFNRRFAPHIVKIKELLNSHRSPKSIIMTVNAGAISSDHWVQDSLIGGGRIIGEGCHFVDLMRHLVGYSIVDFQAMMIGKAPGIEIREDKVSITISFEDGSFGTIHYLANGGSIFPKERIEVFCDNAVLKMDNYRLLEGYGWSGFRSMKLFKQDKGQKACVKAFVDAIREGNASPIPYNELIESSRVSIEIAEFLRQRL